MVHQRGMSHAVESSTLADVLERVLDKGIVIAGDIRVKLVDIELLSIQIRLVICSVDKAKEMGMDWWVNNPIFRRGEDQETLASS
ncbi:MAG TPA: gas vesicle protein GvpJ, partial [Terriglobia bacterium]|nr:gas vesicle protein GvpJ [Terriglobia bacterium]